MERFERYILIAILSVICILLASAITGAKVPCTAYPGAYFKTKEFGKRIEAFQLKHGRLPQPGNPGDVAELGLEHGLTFDTWGNEYTFTLRVVQGVHPAPGDSSLHPFIMGFDGPWTVYSAKSRRVFCGVG